MFISYQKLAAVYHGNLKKLLMYTPNRKQYLLKEKRKRSDLVLWQKPPTPTEQSKKQRDNIKTPPKTLITQLLRTDLGRSVGVTAVTQLVWLKGTIRNVTTLYTYQPNRSEEIHYQAYEHNGRVSLTINTWFFPQKANIISFFFLSLFFFLLKRRFMKKGNRSGISVNNRICIGATKNVWLYKERGMISEDQLDRRQSSNWWG